MIAVLQVLWKGHSFVPRSVAFIVDTIAKIILKIVPTRLSNTKDDDGFRKRDISPETSGRLNPSRSPPVVEKRVVLARPLSHQKLPDSVKLVKVSLIRHRWAWQRLLMVSKRKNEMHKLVMAGYRKTADRCRGAFAAEFVCYGSEEV